MARQGNHNNQRAAQPDWEDVTVANKAITQQWGGLAIVTLDTDGCTPTRGAMRVRVAWYSGGSTQVPADESVTALWPTYQNKTMPGLLFRLHHQLDHALWMREAAAQEGLPF